jgi:hypothetical protein
MWKEMVTAYEYYKVAYSSFLEELIKIKDIFNKDPGSWGESRICEFPKAKKIC